MNTSSIPSDFSLQYSSEQIREHISIMAGQISDWVVSCQNSTGRDPIAIPVLRGAIFFFSDLVRSLSSSVEITPARTQGYAGNLKMSEKFVMDISDIKAKGRSLLLVDDICDTGRTLRRLQEEFLSSGAADVKSAVLIRRLIPESEYIPDWFAFEYSGPEWFVGYGMDDGERWRNLSSVYTIAPRV